MPNLAVRVDTLAGSGSWHTALHDAEEMDDGCSRVSGPWGGADVGGSAAQMRTISRNWLWKEHARLALTNKATVRFDARAR